MSVANYADDTSPYIYGENIEYVIKLLEQPANVLFNWFKNNQIKGNEDKGYILLSTDTTVQVNIGYQMWTLLGIKIDCKLNFDDHIGKICKKAGAKLNALTRVA